MLFMHKAAFGAKVEEFVANKVEVSNVRPESIQEMDCISWV